MARWPAPSPLTAVAAASSASAPSTSVQAVAAELGVHPQTVRYRIRQLRELFGTRLEDPEARFELALALRVG